MADAGPMIDRCFQHQHPEAYGRPEVSQEFPTGAGVTAEVVPEGANQEAWTLRCPCAVCSEHHEFLAVRDAGLVEGDDVLP